LKKIILFVLPFYLFSCSTLDEHEEVKSDIGDNKIEVFIRGGQFVESTRTTIDDDLASTRWSEDDFIHIWAKSNSGEDYSIDCAPFGIKYFGTEYNNAVFTAFIDPMDEGNYTYYGVYPEPKSRTGTIVNYTIPSEQKGVYDGTSDIMVATPTTAPQLEAKDGDFELPFRHLTHIIRIEIPNNRNHLNDPISRIDITFPQAIVGDISFDATTENVVPEFSNGSNSISIKFDKPIDGDGQYAWVFINPTTLNGEISFVGYDINGYRSYSISTHIDKSMEAGRITPLKLTIPQELERTTLIMKITENNLGEEIQKVIFSAPDGALFRNGKQTWEQAYNSSNIYELSYYAELYSNLLKSTGIAVNYESEHALVSGKPIVLSAVKPNDINEINIQVPYLLFEDFSTVQSFSEHDNIKTGMSGIDVSYEGITDLSSKGLPSGWTAGRVGAVSGKSIRIACREEAGAKHPGRIDTPPLSGIKEGSSIKISVTYDYSGGEIEWKGWGGKLGTPIYSYGYTTTAGGFHGNQDLENTIASNIYQGTSGNFNSVSMKGRYTLESCSNKTRLSWSATVEKAYGWVQNGNYWLYLDNIKVQITK